MPIKVLRKIEDGWMKGVVLRSEFFFQDVKEYVENIQWRMKIISVNTPGGSWCNWGNSNESDLRSAKRLLHFSMICRIIWAHFWKQAKCWWRCYCFIRTADGDPWWKPKVHHPGRIPFKMSPSPMKMTSISINSNIF